MERSKLSARTTRKTTSPRRLQALDAQSVAARYHTRPQSALIMSESARRRANGGHAYLRRLRDRSGWAPLAASWESERLKEKPSKPFQMPVREGFRGGRWS